MSKEQLDELKVIAEHYRWLYNTGQCSREQAKENIMPYLNAVNEKSKEIAKKYKQRPRKVDFAAFIR